MKRWLSRRKLNRSMQEYAKMTKVYYEWRTNQEMERRVLFDKQDADVAGQAVRKILAREQEQDRRPMPHCQRKILFLHGMAQGSRVPERKRRGPHPVTSAVLTLYAPLYSRRHPSLPPAPGRSRPVCVPVLSGERGRISRCRLI